MHAPVRDYANRPVGSRDAPNPRSVHRSSTSPPERNPSTSTSVGGALLRLESPPPGCRPRPAPRPALRAGRAPGRGGARPAACTTTGLRCSARARGGLCILRGPLISPLADPMVTTLGEQLLEPTGGLLGWVHTSGMPTRHVDHRAVEQVL